MVCGTVDKQVVAPQGVRVQDGKSGRLIDLVPVQPVGGQQVRGLVPRRNAEHRPVHVKANAVCQRYAGHFIRGFPVFEDDNADCVFIPVMHDINAAFRAFFVYRFVQRHIEQSIGQPCPVRIAFIYIRECIVMDRSDIKAAVVVGCVCRRCIGWQRNRRKRVRRRTEIQLNRGFRFFDSCVIPAAGIILHIIVRQRIDRAVKQQHS